jgi:uncharacterized membrane protein YtjA (UPF0391 family)
MIEASVSGYTDLLGSTAGIGPIVFIAILVIFLWEAAIVLSAVLATVSLNRKKTRPRG